MKTILILLAFSLALAFGSCTTAYKTGQTPDDVYFSPALPEDEYARVDKRDNRQYSGDDEYYDDRYLRMKVMNRNQWGRLDDWYYYGNQYNYSYYSHNYWNNPWTPYNYWNYAFNPYFNHGVVIVRPVSPLYSGPRTVNLNSYSNNTSITRSNYVNPKTPGGNYNQGFSPRRYTNSYNSSGNNNTRSNGNTGSFLRNAFRDNSNNNSSNNNNTNTTPRSSTPSSSGSSGSSGSGSSAPVRRF